MISEIKIGPRFVGAGHPCFVIAEAGVNHNGDVDLARRLIDAAAEAGANAIKFQTFRADRLVTSTAPKAAYQQAATGADESQFEMLRRLELSEAAHDTLFTHANSRGLAFLSTPFDERSADLLGTLKIPGFKISSGELTNLPFLEHVARLGSPLIVSTGMATLEEVRTAVAAIRAAGNPRIALLQCVSNYPANPADTNLRAMKTMRDSFGIPVGYSDHTLGNEVALAAVALGACIVEKHLTLDRSLPGPDHAASAEPAELTALVHGIRAIESALGDGVKRPAASEAGVAAVARRSLVTARDIAAGETLDDAAITALRPGGGLPPGKKATLLNRRALQAIPAGTVLQLEMLE
jgi:N-acetylneuraminate synthase/N,N'-diacetyllegionaminate synthase